MKQTQKIHESPTGFQQNTAFYSSVSLVSCLVVAAVVCYGQIRGSTFLLFLGLTAFLALVLYVCNYSLSLAVLLFFLPWSPLLKLQLGQFSFFTIAMLLVGLLYFFRNGAKFKSYQVICPAMLMATTLIAKAIQGNGIALNYLFFFSMLILFPCIASEFRTFSSFWTITIFFSFGIITSALSAQKVAGFANISRFIKVDSYLTITRLSGYYGDPNFYSAQITACLAGVLLLLVSEKDRLRQLILIVIAVTLGYCGLLSASKMFVVVIAALVAVWIPLLLEAGNKNRGYSLLLGIICAAVLVLSSKAFQALFRIIDVRFSYASNLSDLTTKRSDIWINYLRNFTYDPILTLFGQGYSAVTLNGKASHNTAIQWLYQFGILGIPFLFTWMLRTLKEMMGQNGLLKESRKSTLLMLGGVLLPWMCLDMLFFDEFFLLPAYASVGIIMANKPSEQQANRAASLKTG